MAVRAEYIRFGDSSIQGIQGGEILWKLTGEGLIHYTPAFETTVTIPSAAFHGGSVTVPIKIWLFGDLRYITVGPVLGVASGIAAPVVAPAGTIPVEHRPQCNRVGVCGAGWFASSVFSYKMDVGDDGLIAFYIHNFNVVPRYITLWQLQEGQVFNIPQLSGWYSVVIS